MAAATAARQTKKKETSLLKNNVKGLFLVSEMHKNPPKVLAVLFDPVVDLFNLTLVQKPQDPFLELAASLARNDFDKFDPFFDRLANHAVQLNFEQIALVVDVVEVKFELGHGAI